MPMTLLPGKLERRGAGTHGLSTATGIGYVASAPGKSPVKDMVRVILKQGKIRSHCEDACVKLARQGVFAPFLST